MTQVRKGIFGDFEEICWTPLRGADFGGRMMRFYVRIVTWTDRVKLDI
jgi:hypothetical protein